VLVGQLSLSLFLSKLGKRLVGTEVTNHQVKLEGITFVFVSMVTVDSTGLELWPESRVLRQKRRALRDIPRFVEALGNAPRDAYKRLEPLVQRGESDLCRAIILPIIGDKEHRTVLCKGHANQELKIRAIRCRLTGQAMKRG
jgi:hypothetical protein